MTTQQVLHVYGPGSATSWSAGWRYLGKAEKVSEALSRWPEATFIAVDPGTPFQTVVWTDKHGVLSHEYAT